MFHFIHWAWHLVHVGSFLSQFFTKAAIQKSGTRLPSPHNACKCCLLCSQLWKMTFKNSTAICRSRDNMPWLLWIIQRPPWVHFKIKPKIQPKISAWLDSTKSEWGDMFFVFWMNSPFNPDTNHLPTIYKLLQCVYVHETTFSKYKGYNPVNMCPKFHSLRNCPLWIPFPVFCKVTAFCFD